ncbi:MAG: chemotaxis protein CheC [Anaerolineae bacterium]
MQLSREQQDALTELINIAFGRTASALSELTGRRVILAAPELSVIPVDQLGQHLSALAAREVATVHQIFTGPLAGDAMLILGYDSAVQLAQLMVGQRPPIQRLDVSDREALTEVGNILLNACLGTFGNILETRISFSVPRLYLESLEGLIDSLVIGHEELRYALVVTTTFELEDSAVSGFLVVALGLASMDRLFEAIMAGIE